MYMDEDGEPHSTTSTCPTNERLASLHADYNRRGDDANDCVQRQEVDEKLFFNKSPRLGADGQGQKAVRPKPQGHEKQLFLIMALQRGADALRSEPVVSCQGAEENIFVIVCMCVCVCVCVCIIHCMCVYVCIRAPVVA